MDSSLPASRAAGIVCNSLPGFIIGFIIDNFILPFLTELFADFACRFIGRLGVWSSVAAKICFKALLVDISNGLWFNFNC